MRAIPEVIKEELHRLAALTVELAAIRAGAEPETSLAETKEALDLAELIRAVAFGLVTRESVKKGGAA